jgi:hypothetical protein
LGVLGQTKLFKPVRDLLHRNPTHGLTALLDESDKEYPKKFPASTPLD